MIPAQLINSASGKLAALLPSPNVTANGVVSDYFGVTNYSFTRDTGDAKVTYNPNDKSSAFGRYSISKDTIADPPQFGAAEGGTWDGGQPGTSFGTIQVGGAGGTYTFTPHLLLDGDIGFTRQHLGSAIGSDLGNNFGLTSGY